MSEVKKRKVHGKEFKAKVGLEAGRGVKTVNQIGQAHQVHPLQVGQWKKMIVEGAGELFEGKRGPRKEEPEINRDALYREIGRRMIWIDDKDEVPLRRQCLLAGVARAAVARESIKLDQSKTVGQRGSAACETAA